MSSQSLPNKKGIFGRALGVLDKKPPGTVVLRRASLQYVVKLWLPAAVKGQFQEGIFPGGIGQGVQKRLAVPA